MVSLRSSTGTVDFFECWIEGCRRLFGRGCGIEVVALKVVLTNAMVVIYRTKS